MAKVRGSKQHRLVVSRHKPARKLLGLLLVVCGVAALAAAGFWFGQQEAQKVSRLTPSERAELQVAKMQVAAIERDRTVDKVALEGARTTIQELQQEIHQLNKTLAFYKGIIAPEDVVKGLYVQALDVQPLGEGRYRLKWILTQIGSHKAVIEGKVSVLVVGMGGEGKEDKSVLSLKNVALNAVSSRFKFRYFQNFETDILLPEGFKVDKIEINAEAVGKKPQTVSREFDWLIPEKPLRQEKPKNVGKRQENGHS